MEFKSIVEDSLAFQENHIDVKIIRKALRNPGVEIGPGRISIRAYPGSNQN